MTLDHIMLTLAPFVIVYGIIEWDRERQRHNWKPFNEWYDMNGHGDMHLNIGRMIRSESWKKQMEDCRKLEKFVNK
jgi:hypothetical protein